MTDNFEELVQHLDAELSASRPDYYSRLQPGASEEQLDALESVLPQGLPGAFRSLYRWKNGQPEYPFESLYGNRSFLSLEEIGEIKQMLDGMIGYDFDDPKYWRRGWVPFLHNGGGSYLCLDLLAEDGGDPGQLIAFWKQDSDRPIEYPDLRAWIQAVIQEQSTE